MRRNTRSMLLLNDEVDKNMATIIRTAMKMTTSMMTFMQLLNKRVDKNMATMSTMTERETSSMFSLTNGVDQVMATMRTTKAG